MCCRVASTVLVVSAPLLLASIVVSGPLNLIGNPSFCGTPFTHSRPDGFVEVPVYVL